MAFIEEQAKKEVFAIKKVWRGFLWLCVIWWVIMGLTFLVTSAWLVGLVFIAAAGYLGYRLRGKTQK